MEGVKDRACYWVDSLAYFNDGQLEVFTTKEEGTIANEVIGENGWGMDKIFIPKIGVEMPIVEGTNEVMRLIVSRDLLDGLGGDDTLVALRDNDILPDR